MGAKLERALVMPIPALVSLAVFVEQDRTRER
jgi:hypothetical protein